MQLLLDIPEATWKRVAMIPRGRILIKGTSAISKEVLLAARGEADRFGCYCWAARGMTLYCGSFSKDYRSWQFKTNFEGRIAQYFRNHLVSKSGMPNTNLRIFNRLNEELNLADMNLLLLKFESLIGPGGNIPFSSYTSDSALIRAVERLLIWTYKAMDECPWNDEALPE
jgi:hypothetical protein